ncbi:MAG TPA: VOC family protein, partial [Chloroflexota bacterium]|nr:VOC family protein [Chloroflexota bacterium]
MDSPKIAPHLWFDNNALEAAEFYVGAFGDSRITSKAVLRDTPSGDCDTVSFELRGQPFMAISAGPLFTFNPSVSFMVNFDPSRDAVARDHLDGLWQQLSDGGRVLMPLDAY